jgi:hypothetical protein
LFYDSYNKFRTNTFSSSNKPWKPSFFQPSACFPSMFLLALIKTNACHLSREKYITVRCWNWCHVAPWKFRLRWALRPTSTKDSTDTFRGFQKVSFQWEKTDGQIISVWENSDSRSENRNENLDGSHWKSENHPTLVPTYICIRASLALPWRWPDGFFSPSKFGSLLFCNPAHKTKTGTANRCATTDRKPHGPTIVMGPTISIAVRSHLIRYFLQVPFMSQGRQPD